MDRQSEENLANPRSEKISKLKGHFFVPSYQRGYRWGQHEIEALMDDIYACRDLDPGIKYCLQPIVVKERISGASADEAR